MIGVDEMLNVLDGVNDLPTLPTIYAQVSQIMQDPKSSVADVARVIEKDQAITSKILRVVNSSFFGFSRQIATIRQAVVLLGYNTIRNTVLSVSVFQSFASAGHGEFDMKEFWKHAIATGVLATYLDKALHTGFQEETFVAGLLHDIGKIILNRYFKEKFEEALTYARTNQETFYDSERAVIGFSHDEVGEYLADRWQLPYSLVEAVALHHQPANIRSNPKLVALTHLANIFAHRLRYGFSGDYRDPEIDTFALEELGIQKEAIPELQQLGKEILEESQALFGLIE